MTPDGPKGPPRKSKPGCILAAKASGVPLIPIAFAVEWARHLRNWDRTAVPLPFSSIVLGYGEPLRIPGDVDRAGCIAACGTLDMAMTNLEARCVETLGAQRNG